MIHWAWLVAATFGGAILGALILGLCAAAGIDGAYHEGYERGVNLGKRIGYEAAVMERFDKAIRKEAA